MLTEMEQPGEAMEADVSAGSVEDLVCGVDNALAIGPGLPQNLGKRSAFPTDTLKTLARFQQLPQAYYCLSTGKKEGWS